MGLPIHCSASPSTEELHELDVISQHKNKKIFLEFLLLLVPFHLTNRAETIEKIIHAKIWTLETTLFSALKGSNTWINLFKSIVPASYRW